MLEMSETERTGTMAGMTQQQELVPWLQRSRFATDREAQLAAALGALIHHDRAADICEGLPYHCVELQHAIEVLNEITGAECFPAILADT
jgi:hypothetical protein